MCEVQVRYVLILKRKKFMYHKIITIVNKIITMIQLKSAIKC